MDKHSKTHADLTPGDWIWHGPTGLFREVRHVEPGEDGENVLVVFVGGHTTMRKADQQPTFATAEQIEQERRHQHRERVADGLHALARLVVDNKVPIDRYGLNFRDHLDSPAEVREWARAVGVETKETPGGYVVAEWRYPAGAKSYESLVTAYVQAKVEETAVGDHADPTDASGEGVSSKAPVRAAAASAAVVEGEPATAAEVTPAHGHAAAWKGGPGPGECGVSCICGATYDGFDTLALASALLDRHIAGTNGAAEVTPESWIFTFGSGQQFDGRFVVIPGSYDQARDEMLRIFGNKWSFQYPADQRADLENCGMVELPRPLWPTAEVTPDLYVPHIEVANWGGSSGSYGVACECGQQFDGFGSWAAARRDLAAHIAKPNTADQDEDGDR